MWKVFEVYVCVHAHTAINYCRRSEPGYHNTDIDFRIRTCWTDYIVEFKKDTIAQSNF